MQAKARRRWFGLLASLLLLALLVLPSDNGPIAYFRSKVRVAALEHNIDSLNLLIDYYQKQIDALRAEDPFAIEREARRFGFTYPGETVYEFEIAGGAANGE